MEDFFNPYKTNRCVAPWIAFQYDPQGFFSPCCVYKGKRNKILDFSDIKEKMILNQKLDGCKKCWDQEEKNIKSRRIMFWESYSNDINLENNFLHADLSLSNTCNLSCLMCCSYNSSQWYKKDKLLQKQNFNRNIFKPNQLNNLTEIKKYLQNIEYIEIKGGEPFYDKKLKELLEFLSKKNVIIDIVTNGIIIPDWFIKLLPTFKSINIYFSIEGIDNLYEYIRGTNFLIFEKNVQKIYKHLNNNIKLFFTPTIMCYNIFNVNDIVLWCNQFTEKINIKPLFSPLYLNINIIPLQYRNNIINNITIEKNKKIIKNMFNTWDKINYIKFKKYVELTDKINKTSFLNIQPIFKDIFWSINE